MNYEDKMKSLTDGHKYEADKIIGGWYKDPNNRKMSSTDDLRNAFIYEKTGNLDHLGKYDGKYDDLMGFYDWNTDQRNTMSQPDRESAIRGKIDGDYAPPKQENFTFSNYTGPNYADRAKSQAEAEAQRKMDEYNQLLKKIRNQEMSTVHNMDRDYFQKYMQTAQGQTNNGLNAGIAAEQNTRLAMSRQAELGNLYQDINAQNFEANNNLARVPVEQLAREHEIFTQLEQLGWEREFAEKQLSQSDRHFLANLGLQRDQFDWSKGVDSRNFGYQQGRDTRRDAEWESTEKFNRWWQQQQFNNMSASQRDASSLAWKQLEEQKRQFNSESAWRQHTFNNMSESEKKQHQRLVDQFGDEMAWNLESLKMSQSFQISLAEAQAGYPYGGNFSLTQGPQQYNGQALPNFLLP